MSECDDTGPDPLGARFPDNPVTHRALALPGISPEEAVGYRVQLQDRTVVVIATAETLGPAARAAIWPGRKS